MELKQIDMNDIKRNPEQPREHFDTDKLKELGESIKEVGLINPITVEKQGSKFEIVAGERRYRGSKEVKNKKILALVKEYKSGGDKAVESLIENAHREDLNPFEKAKFLMKIREIEGLETDKALGKRVGMSTSAIEFALRYLKLDKRIVEKVSRHKLHPRTAVTMASLKKEDQRKIVTKVQKLTKDEAAKAVSIVREGTKPLKEAILKDEITVDEAEDIKDFDEEKQKVAIKGIKLMKRTIKEMPKAIKDVDTEKKTALDVIKKLQSELGSTTGKMYKMSHILDNFHKEKVFDVIPKDYKKTILHIIKELEKGTNELSKSVEKVKEDLK